MSYKVKLELFEGPLDLLLHLIKKEELDIYNVPISKITEQYLAYLDFMQMLDLNIAGEFLVMAATLMHIKSKMLLPKPEGIDEEVEEEDPRSELIKRLLEYKKFKEAAGELSMRAQRQKDFFARGVALPEMGDAMKDGLADEPFEASLFDLIGAFTKVMKEVPKELFHEIIKDEFTVEEKMHDIFHMLVKTPKLSFYALFEKARSKTEVITIFLALLELIRLKEILAVQDGAFGDINIERNKEAISPPAEGNLS